MAIEHDYITAELSNKQTMKALELFPIYKEKDGEMVLEGYRPRTVPTPELAREVVATREKINRHYGGIEVRSEEEIDALCRADHEFELMGLDLRSQPFEKDGMTGLRSVTGEVLVPPMPGVSFPERYSPFSHMRFAPIGTPFFVCERDGKAIMLSVK